MNPMNSNRPGSREISSRGSSRGGGSGLHSRARKRRARKRTESRARLLQLLEWEKAMEIERRAMTTSYYWSKLLPETRDRLQNVFDQERGHTDSMVRELLTDYKPSLSGKSKDEMNQRLLRQARLGGGVGGGAVGGPGRRASTAQGSFRSGQREEVVEAAAALERARLASRERHNASGRGALSRGNSRPQSSSRGETSGELEPQSSAVLSSRRLRSPEATPSSRRGIVDDGANTYDVSKSTNPIAFDLAPFRNGDAAASVVEDSRVLSAMFPPIPPQSPLTGLRPSSRDLSSRGLLSSAYAGLSGGLHDIIEDNDAGVSPRGSPAARVTTREAPNLADPAEELEPILAPLRVTEKRRRGRRKRRRKRRRSPSKRRSSPSRNASLEVLRHD